jgi:hypothetical protein
MLNVLGDVVGAVVGAVVGTVPALGSVLQVTAPVAVIEVTACPEEQSPPVIVNMFGISQRACPVASEVKTFPDP